MIRRRNLPDSTSTNTKKFKTEADDAKALLNEDEKHEGLAKELLRLTSTLKHNFTTAGSVIKDDNAVCYFIF